MNKYKSYTSIDFLNDDSFVQWLLKKDQNAQFYWEVFIEEYPEKKAEIDEAVEIFNHFRFTHEELSLDEVFSIWNDVKHQPEKKRLGFLVVLKYAAVFLLIFAAGAVSY